MTQRREARREISVRRRQSLSHGQHQFAGGLRTRGAGANIDPAQHAFPPDILLGRHFLSDDTPSIVCFELRDGEGTEQGIKTVTSPPDAGAYGTLLSRSTYGTTTNNCAVIGPSKTHLRFEDISTTDFLDTTAAVVPGSWTCDNGRTVSAVHRKTVPYRYGEGYGDLVNGVATVKTMSMAHSLYLQFDAPLTSGTTYRITPPTGSGFTNFFFKFDPLKIRCGAISHNHIGHALADDMKQASIIMAAFVYQTAMMDEKMPRKAMR